LVELAISTSSIYEATAALDLLFDAYESYPETITEFEIRHPAADGNAKKRIVGCLGYLLRNGENRRPIVGKHFTEVGEDSKFFKGLASRADALKNAST
jgi:hypothetical protein